MTSGLLFLRKFKYISAIEKARKAKEMTEQDHCLTRYGNASGLVFIDGHVYRFFYIADENKTRASVTQ